MTSRTLADMDRRLHAVARRAWLVAVVAVTALAALIGVASQARAFSNIGDYGKYPDPNDDQTWGGGGGRYFTGTPADGYTCDVCHSAPVKYSFPIVQKGLPTDGYVPGMSYNVELSWPTSTAYEAMAIANHYDPQTELVAEIVAEDGSSAGTLSFVSNKAEVAHENFPGLYCPADPGVTVPDDQNAWASRYAMTIYATERDKKQVEMVLAKSGDACEISGEDGERRCVIAVQPCGATSAKFTWTAPMKWSGPIWFSAGLVTTADKSGEPDDQDYVTVLSIPMNAAYEGGTYENVLQTGCSVAGGPTISSRSYALRGVWLTMFVGAPLLRASRRFSRRCRQRVRRRRPLPLLAALGLVLCCLGCSDSPILVTRVTGAVGLYEPGGCDNCDMPPKCRVGAWQDAGTPMDAGSPATTPPASGAVPTQQAQTPAGQAPATATTPPTSGAAATPPAAGTGAMLPGSGVGTTPPTTGAGTPPPTAASAPIRGPQAQTYDDKALTKPLGTTMVDFTTAQPAGWVSPYVNKCGGNCSPYYMAVWIENANHMYVRTLWLSPMNYAGISLPHYMGMGAVCEKESKTTPDPDVLVMATPIAHKPYQLMWDGVMANGKPAPAGTYRLRIELAIDDPPKLQMPVADIPFAIGDMPKTTMAPPMPPHAGVTIAFTPTP